MFVVPDDGVINGTGLFATAQHHRSGNDVQQVGIAAVAFAFFCHSCVLKYVPLDGQVAESNVLGTEDEQLLPDLAFGEVQLLDVIDGFIFFASADGFLEGAVDYFNEATVGRLCRPRRRWMRLPSFGHAVRRAVVFRRRILFPGTLNHTACLPIRHSETFLAELSPRAAAVYGLLFRQVKEALTQSQYCIGGDVCLPDTFFYEGRQRFII